MAEKAAASGMFQVCKSTSNKNSATGNFQGCPENQLLPKRRTPYSKLSHPKQPDPQPFCQRGACSQKGSESGRSG
ncbi:hypothetical protein WR25_14269 [Diploscapter pachys]|uniref:Uncharacterized protein n=1 Tax=Diploscapter pachys TaxID=2018661 RepID=A0A2A2KMX0_9BILA|nr:hypothetical protein WR25_14269 [Diploscapter pachys]